MTERNSLVHIRLTYKVWQEGMARRRTKRLNVYGDTQKEAEEKAGKEQAYIQSKDNFCEMVSIEVIGEEHSFYIFDSETNRMYHTIIKKDSSMDLLAKFAMWDMKGDDAAINDVLMEIKTDEDADDYFRDRGCVILGSDKVEEF